MTEPSQPGASPRWASLLRRLLRRADPGRRLRVLAGVDERVLAQVPLERTRYTGLGGVVLGTAAMAGMSMWFALSQVLGGAHPAMLVPVLIWALIVLNLDRWLVSTVTGMWQRRLLMLIPRLLVAVVLGAIIAEPIVLRVFETAVVQHVKDQRSDARDKLKARLVECNPRPPATPKRQDCGDSRLLAATTEANAAELANLQKDAAALQKQIDAANRRHNKLVDQTSGECAGDKGRGLSGREGEGPRCRRLQEEARRVFASSRIAGNTARLEALTERISQLRGPLAVKEAAYQKELDARIQERVAQLPAPNDPVGLLERMKALHELTTDNTYLATASWLFRLFLIMVDCLPVLVKLMGGTTVYDRMVGEENRRREAIHTSRVRFEADEEIGELELNAYARTEGRRKRRQDIDVDRKATDVAARKRIEEMIDTRTRELRRGTPGEQRNGVHPRLDPFRGG
ncbi:DUF4407 domain-containing protein [Nonomuraea sp. NPDC000554]|uniref:DUF4407 domain-containing protein n=1 Tax=Nonomuraea sp. NPDC000554 TaxID=3154259 RepID=UPI00332D0B66